MRHPDRPDPALIEMEREADGRYAIGAEPTLWEDLGLFGIIWCAVGAIGLAMPFVKIAVWAMS